MDLKSKKLQIEKRRGATIQEPSVTILTASCHFKGKLYCKGTSRIAGKIEGEIISEGLLLLEEAAEIDAVIHGEEVCLAGNMRGTIYASRKIELLPTCCLEGSLHTPVLVVQEGAHMQGQIKMEAAEPLSSTLDQMEAFSVQAMNEKFDLPLSQVDMLEETNLLL
jgi:cytoskeletal protein CcmA (bactofilin family)